MLEIIIIFRFLFIFILFCRHWIIRKNCAKNIKECWKVKNWAKVTQICSNLSAHFFCSQKKDTKKKDKINQVTCMAHDLAKPPIVIPLLSLSSFPLPLLLLLLHPSSQSNAMSLHLPRQPRPLSHFIHSLYSLSAVTHASSSSNAGPFECLCHQWLRTGRGRW